MITEFDELIKTGAVDITTRESVEDEADRDARAAEPGAYALTYEEAITVKRAHNIIETVVLQNDFVSYDTTTRTRTFILNPESTQKIIEAFEQRGFDADELYLLADRVLSGNWYTLIISSQYSPGKGKGPGFCLIANVNGKRDEGILKIEDYPAVYDGSNRAAQRDALKLPRDAGFLFSAEWADLETLRQVCDRQMFIEERIGYLQPYDLMPNSASLTFVSRIFNSPYVWDKDLPSVPERDTRTTIETITADKGEGNELIIKQRTRNSTTTLTFSDYELFCELSTGKTRRGTLSGVKKVWRFALQKLMQQSTSHTTPAAITIDLEEMVTNGMFANVGNAYRAISTMVKKMGLFHIEQDFTETVTAEDGKKKRVKKSHGGLLFYASDREGTIAHILVNQQFEFEFFRRQYTYFPSSWAYKLDGNAFSLTEYLFSLMRLNADEITDKGKFCVKLTTIHNQLGLRDIDDVRDNCNRRFNDYIKKPLLQAVEEVNRAAAADKEINGKFKIKVKTADTQSIEKWLEGCLEITASGDYTAHLNGIAEGQRLFDTTYKEEKIRQAATRRARSKAKSKKST